MGLQPTMFMLNMVLNFICLYMIHTHIFLALSCAYLKAA